MKRYEQFNIDVLQSLIRTVWWAMQIRKATDFKCGSPSSVPCNRCPIATDSHKECYDKLTAKGWLDWAFEDVEDTEEEEGCSE